MDEEVETPLIEALKLALEESRKVREVLEAELRSKEDG